MDKVKSKSLIAMLLVMLFTSSAFAQATVIDLQEKQEIKPYQEIIDKINEYEVIGDVAKHYDTISITIEDTTLVLEFENNKLDNIHENTNILADLSLEFTRDDINFLMDNWKTMSSFDKIKFFINSDMPIKDVLIFSGIAMGVRI